MLLSTGTGSQCLPESSWWEGTDPTQGDRNPLLLMYQLRRSPTTLSPAETPHVKISIKTPAPWRNSASSCCLPCPEGEEKVCSYHKKATTKILQCPFWGKGEAKDSNGLSLSKQSGRQGRTTAKGLFNNHSDAHWIPYCTVHFPGSWARENV